jgi:energy-coupling factor transport system permease protein
MLDPRVSLIWVLTTLAVASPARNPLYAVLLLLMTTVVGVVCHGDVDTAMDRAAAFSPLRFGAIAVPASALFNALTVHIGDTVLLHLPGWLPLLGGPITLEALIFGLQNGLVLTIVFAGFGAFNEMTPARDLVGLTPRAFHEVGVILSIALTFAPQTLRSLNRIRQAQALRGHRMRGLRDWPPIIVPLLVSSLERSMGLAEAMVARGYGAIANQAQPLGTSVGLSAGLLTVLAGWLMFLFRSEWRQAGLGGMLAGAAVIAGVVWLAGRSVRHTVYRPRRWTVRDTLVLAGCGLALAVVWLPTPSNLNTLYYVPYPRLTLPPFDPWVGLGLLGLLFPAALAKRVPRLHRPQSTVAEPATEMDVE